MPHSDRPATAKPTSKPFSLLFAICAHRGDGYDIHIEHTLSDHGDSLVDLVLVTLHQD